MIIPGKAVVPGPKDPYVVDLKLSDYELFRQCLPDIQEDTCQDVAWSAS